MIDHSFLDGASIPVTGGTGSFGKRMVRTLLRETRARRVVVYSRDELKQDEMSHAPDDADSRLLMFIAMCATATDCRWRWRELTLLFMQRR